MDWTLVAQLIVNIGLPAAEKLIAKWENNGPVTVAEFQEVKAAATQTAADRMKVQLQAAGIALDDPKAIALLALATGSPPPQATATLATAPAASPTPAAPSA